MATPNRRMAGLNTLGQGTSSEFIDTSATNSSSKMRAWAIASRVEYMPGGLFFVFASAALACLHWDVLWDSMALVVQGVTVWYISHLIGSQVNCIADVEIDKSDKERLARAVSVVGSRVLWVSILWECAIVLCVSVFMAVETDKPILPLLWIVGLGVALGYSLEPVRFKRRNWANPLSLLLVLYVLPMSYGYIALADKVDVHAISFAVGVGLQMFALILLNPAEDLATDRTAGIDTPCTIYGLRMVGLVASAFFAVGLGFGIRNIFALGGSSQWLFTVGIAFVILAQTLILGDIVLFAMFAPRGLVEPSGRTLRAAKRNAVHFAILGVTFALACVLVLT
jgi:4-hydroxybenzoate polyprenyltransferase